MDDARTQAGRSGRKARPACYEYKGIMIWIRRSRCKQSGCTHYPLRARANNSDKGKICLHHTHTARSTSHIADGSPKKWPSERDACVVFFCSSFVSPSPPQEGSPRTRPGVRRPCGAGVRGSLAYAPLGFWIYSSAGIDRKLWASRFGVGQGRRFRRLLGLMPRNIFWVPSSQEYLFLMPCRRCSAESVLTDTRPGLPKPTRIRAGRGGMDGAGAPIAMVRPLSPAEEHGAAPSAYHAACKRPNPPITPSL